MDLTPALADLTDKQRLYVQARLEGSSPELAARRAGSEVPKKDWRLYEIHPKVQAALQKGREISMQQCGVTRERVSEMLQEAYRNAATAMEQIAAAKELGKLWGVYEAAKVQVEHRLGNVKSEQELRALSVADLEALTAIEGEFIDVTPITEKALVRRA